MECQICFEATEPDNHDGNHVIITTKLCGDQCTAQICSNCLARHVEVTLDKFYAGLLPKVRCLICLTLMASDRWQPFVASLSDAGVRYEKLCRQACALRPPCCHKVEYTHLPAFSESDRLLLTGETDPSEDAKSESSHVLVHLRKTRPVQLDAFLARLDRYCGHEAQADSALALADAFVDVLADEPDPEVINSAFMRLLPIICDSERRATLLLAFLFRRPITRTLCCNFMLCYNCKRSGKHANCISKTFNEDSALVQCRGCRATLLKVDGCDSVVCLCGFDMSWTRELTHKRKHLRGLYPVSIFDAQFDNWTEWNARLQFVFGPIDDIVTKRALRLVLTRPVVGARIRASMLAATRRWKFRRGQRIVGEHLHRAPSAKRQRLQDVETFLAKVGRVLRVARAEHIAWHRWRLRMARVQPELFWKCYWRDHQQELAGAAEEQGELLGLFCGL